MSNKHVNLVAEVGCNHKGSLDLAKKHIDAVSDCDVKYVKFQKRDNRLLLTEEQFNSPHPNPTHSYGKTYGEHREFLEFNPDQHLELKLYCEQKNLVYSTSVWDRKSALQISNIHPEFIKVPSACNNNIGLLQVLANEFGGDIHISLGMTSLKEEDGIMKFFDDANILNRVVLYSCTSGYPVRFEDICLLEITRISNKYGSQVKGIGFSGHHLGIAVDIAALPLGVNWIERHFTLDRTWKGTDHAASLEPQGLKKLQRDISNVSKSLTFKQEEILDVEKPQREKLKWKSQN